MTWRKCPINYYLKGLSKKPSGNDLSAIGVGICCQIESNLLAGIYGNEVLHDEWSSLFDKHGTHFVFNDTFMTGIFYGNGAGLFNIESVSSRYIILDSSNPTTSPTTEPTVTPPLNTFTPSVEPIYIPSTTPTIPTIRPTINSLLPTNIPSISPVVMPIIINNDTKIETTKLKFIMYIVIGICVVIVMAICIFLIKGCQNIKQEMDNSDKIDDIISSENIIESPSEYDGVYSNAHTKLPNITPMAATDPQKISNTTRKYNTPNGILTNPPVSMETPFNIVIENAGIITPNGDSDSETNNNEGISEGNTNNTTSM